MHVYLTHNGSDVMLRTDEVARDGRYRFRVTWTNRWDLVDELVAAGRLERLNLGPSTFGHCEYFYP